MIIAAVTGPGRVIDARRRESCMAVRSPARSHRAAAALLVLALAVAACGATSTGATGSASVPSGSGGAVAASGATAGAGATDPGASGAIAEADPAAAILIATPFGLTTLPASTADTLQATFEKDLGGFGKAVRVGARSITRDGASVAFLLAVRFPRQTLDAKAYADAVSVLEQGAETSFSRQLISNVEVTTGTMGGGQVGLFRKGDTLVVVLASSNSIVVPVVTALIAANG
jgi:hypothetical protein